MQHSKISSEHAYCPDTTGQMVEDIMDKLINKPLGTIVRQACRQKDGSCWKIRIEQMDPGEYEKI